jgi:hypothetical protein
MIRRIAINAQPLALSLKFTNIRTYGIIAVFVVLSVLVPWVFHQFHLAGATYLPMHFFIFMAALASGWQAGVIVGLLTPFASYVVSGMPVWNVLPQIAVEVTAYGLLAGILRQKFNLRVIWSLLGAMLGGRLALLLAVIVIEFTTGAIHSPLGAEAGPSLSVWHTIKQAWPGMLSQIILIPVIFWTVGRFSLKKQPE